MVAWKWMAGIALAVLVAGCSNTTTKVKGALGFDTEVRLTFDVSSDINPDSSGRPSPLMVRVYELKSPTLFERANFIDLYQRDQQVLGADYIAKHDIRRLTPGDERVETLMLSDDAQYIAVFAEFTRYQDANFAVLIPVKSHSKTKEVVQIKGNQLAQAD